MKITLLLFASCREALGETECLLDIEDGATVADLRRQLPVSLPALQGIAPYISFAVNEEYATEQCTLLEGDKVALIPPVSGGSEVAFLLTDEVIASDAHVWVGGTGDGAVVKFEGIVRDHAQGTATDYLEYEAYGPMAQRTLVSIAKQARQQWDVGDIAIWHRTGRLNIGEIAVLITVASPHRAAAFAACKFLIDRIKEVAPIWKREVGPDGAYWVEGPGATVLERTSSSA